MHGRRWVELRRVQQWVVAVTLLVLLGGVSWGLAQSVANGGSASAQAPGPASESKPRDDVGTRAQIRVQSNLVTTPVTVIDRATDEFVYDLEKKDFEIYDNGVPQKIQRFDREPHKIAVVIVIQNSDSVAPLLNGIKPLASLFSQLMLGSKGEAAVIFYAGQVRQVQDFSSSGSMLDKTLQSLAPEGSGARLNDAVVQAMNILARRPRQERRVIVVFSTGYDSGSSTSKEEVIRRATDAEVEIYGLGLSLTKATLTRKPQPQVAQNPLDANVTGPSVPGRPSTPSSSQQSFGVPADITQDLETAARTAKTALTKNNMQSFCSYTGGIFYTQWSREALQVHLNQIASEIHSQYELAYVPDDLSRLGFHRIEIKVNRPGTRVRTRLGYFYEGPRQ
jgi:VWFA-related protein